ncbi:MAG: hypothetical protein KDC23_00355 [Actinobacteria bacterium]|nr:hypothetical protein [Actinomycetota bacterium]
MRFSATHKSWPALLVALVALLALVVPISSAAAAEGDVEDTVDLNLSVAGATGTDSTSVPVLPGLVPVSLRTKLEGGSRSLSAAGNYTLEAGGNTAIVDSREAADITIPLDEASVVDGAIPVTLTARFLDDLGCADVDISEGVVARVNEAIITYSGAPENPTTPADFFSAAVRTITLVTADDQVSFTSPAVLQAAASLATEFPRAQISTGQGADAGPYARIVEFIPDAGPVQVTVDAVGATPRMVLRGDAASLVPAAAALGSTDLALATDPQSSALSQTGATGTALSLRWSDVGGQAPVLEGLGTVSQAVTLAQTRFGGPISELEVKVSGTYIPVPTNAGATVSLLINDRLVASERLGDGYTYTLQGTVTPEDMTRNTQVKVELDSAPIGGDCRAAIWVPRVDIDANASTFTAKPGQTLPPGFERFPQVLRGELPVAFAKGPNPADLSNAVDLVASVSRLEVNAPAVSVVSVEEFDSSSQSALLINAGPQESTSLGAPLPFDPKRSPVTSDPSFSVTVERPFAAFEAFENSGRDLLMLGAFPADDVPLAASLQTDLATAVAPAPDGWFGLTGDVMFIGDTPRTGPDGTVEATFLSVNTPPVGEAVQVESEDSGVQTWLWVASLLVLLLAVVVLVLWLLSRGAKRNGDSAEQVDAPGGPGQG